MNVRAGPTLPRRQLGVELRRLRTRLQRTPADVRDALGWSESKLSRVETAATGISRADLESVLDYYGADAADRARLLGLHGQARRRPWWEAYGDALPDAYQTFIGFESEATAIYNYEAQLIPGLLQTAEYSEAVTQPSVALQDPTLVDDRVRVRMARQAVLTGESPPKFWAIIDEAALRRPVGGEEVQRRQMLRLVEASGLPTVTIQVLKFDAGAHPALGGSFVVLEFGDGSGEPLVYSEGMTGGVFRDKREDIEAYTLSFEALRTLAISPEESVEFIQSLAADDH
jgi:transcriptional regulator with XRE-family HTH domain